MLFEWEVKKDLKNRGVIGAACFVYLSGEKVVKLGSSPKFTDVEMV